MGNAVFRLHLGPGSIALSRVQEPKAILDAKLSKKIAPGAAVAISLPATGWGANGAVTGLGINTTGPYIERTVYDALRGEAPRGG